MDQKFNTSFIPKKFLAENVETGSTPTFAKRRGVMGPAYFIALLLFLVALLASAGVFGYTRVTQLNVEGLIESLTTKSASVNMAEIESYIQLHERFQNASTLLNQHVAVSELFTALEEETLRNIRYLTFAFSRGEGGGSPMMTLSGVANNFQPVALQVEQFKAHEMLLAPTVTLLERSETGDVAFGIQMGIDPRLISYTAASVAATAGGQSSQSTRPTGNEPPRIEALPTGDVSATGEAQENSEGTTAEETQ